MPLSGKPGFHPIYKEDFKFKTWNEIEKPDSKAVVLAMMDTFRINGTLGKIYGTQLLLLDDPFLKDKV